MIPQGFQTCMKLDTNLQDFSENVQVQWYHAEIVLKSLVVYMCDLQLQLCAIKTQ